MRSATTSTIARTSSICGSSISCTPMKPGPTTFQWACFRVSCRSLRACRRPWRISAVRRPVLRDRPGTVYSAAFFSAMVVLLLRRDGRAVGDAPCSAIQPRETRALPGPGACTGTDQGWTRAPGMDRGRPALTLAEAEVSEVDSGSLDSPPPRWQPES